MAEYPLLIFHEPAHAERAKRSGRGGKLHIPDHQRQAGRLSPQFNRLQDAMNNRRIALQDNPIGIEPEKVLVLETVGSIDDFFKAVRKIDGLEWLAEIETDEILPEHGFKDETKPDKKLSGRFFMVMTDQLALQQMISLFNKWQKNRNVTFDRGLAKWKDTFNHLKEIRTWDARDRIQETGVIEDWEERLKFDQEQEDIPFEAELWFRTRLDRQQQADEYIQEVIRTLGGKVMKPCIIPEIAYHGILATIPRDRAQETVSYLKQSPEAAQYIQNPLFMCDQIMYIRPTGQCAVPIPEDAGTDIYTHQETQHHETPTGDPVVALFDGLPLTGHQLLDNRIILDDPDGYESSYLANQRSHGTHMASLICHGDLNERSKPIQRPLYVRPIMKPIRGFNNQFKETIPEDVLLTDLIHRCVRRLYETENDQQPVAPNIRAINLSIGDPRRPFYREMSPLARLIDWLSYKYNVLFLVSAGNHTHDIKSEIPRGHFSTLNPEQREKHIIQTIAKDTRNRRLLSPAETVNGLTIGATHEDASTNPYPSLLNPFTKSELPNAISAHGPGYRRSIKPDIVLPGGQVFLNEKLGSVHNKTTLTVQPDYPRPPGQRVADPGTPGGVLDSTRHNAGTSNATAIASRSASLIYEIIEQLRADAPTRLPPEYDAVLLKTLLVHGSDWSDAFQVYESVLSNNHNRGNFKDYVGRFLGYGLADTDKATVCTDQRATVLGVGKLNDGEAHEYSLPLPPSLSAKAENRRLVITLSWFTPISRNNQKYRVAHLWFDPKRDNVIASDRMQADYRTVLRGTVQHEVLEGDKAQPFQDGKDLMIKINCRSDAGDIAKPIAYALAVTLQVKEGIDIPIYQEIRERIQIPVPV